MCGRTKRGRSSVPCYRNEEAAQRREVFGSQHAHSVLPLCCSCGYAYGITAVTCSRREVQYGPLLLCINTGDENGDGNKCFTALVFFLSLEQSQGKIRDKSDRAISSAAANWQGCIFARSAANQRSLLSFRVEKGCWDTQFNWLIRYSSRDRDEETIYACRGLREGKCLPCKEK